MAITYDLLVIGAGPGGYTAAIKAAGLGLKTAVIEKDKVGGTCLNRGCIPTKALLHASSLFSMMQRCDQFGVSVEEMSFDFGKMQEYKKKAVRSYRGNVEDQFEKLGIDLIHGKAVIRRNHNVEVHGESGKEYYSAKNIIIVKKADPLSPGQFHSAIPIITGANILGIMIIQDP
jgi:dihydrolipoamide dehydrogenase